MMQWRVLGYQSPYPGPGGATPGYLLESSGMRILVDCGSGVLAQLSKYLAPWSLDAVWLSHLHHDHIADFFVLQYAIQTEIRMGRRSSPLIVTAPDEPEPWSSKLFYHQAVRHQPVSKEHTFHVGDMEVTWWRTDHGIPCYAMEIKSKNGQRILYGADAGLETDWSRIPRKPDLFVCEGTYLHQDMPPKSIGHHSVKQAAQVAEKMGAKRLLLTHLYPGYSRESIRKEASNHYSGELLLADIGMMISLT